MALIPLYPDDFRFNSVKTHPRQTFSSSSMGVSGDVFLFAERSRTLKNISLELEEYIFDIRSNLEYDGSAPSLTGVRGQRKYNISNIVSSYISNAANMSSKLDQDKKLITYRQSQLPSKFIGVGKHVNIISHCSTKLINLELDLFLSKSYVKTLKNFLNFW